MANHTTHAKRFSEDEAREIADLYRAGATYRTLMHRYGCRARALQTALRDQGVEPRTGRALSDAEEQELADWYEAGATYAEIQARTGVTAATVRKILRRRGVRSRGRGGQIQSFTPERITEIGGRWKAGESQTKIALSLGVSQSRIGRVLAAHGITVEHRRPVGEKHGSWKGGRSTNRQGYVLVQVAWDDPLASMRLSNGYVAEHRLVMARALGRPLTRDETVHHVNGDKADNRLENLQLRNGQHGNGVSARCASCGSRDLVFDDLE